MQIMIFVLILIALVAFIVFRVNNKFGTKEITILISLIIISIGGILYSLQENETKVPEIFKERYQANKNAKILKFSFERLNNKNVSSSTEFIYNFDYIISKDGNEYVCSLKNVVIKKIEDEYIFNSFDKLDENCSKNKN
ncbi:MAG: hypothetical protein WBF48_00580 [Halarcobacter sp.]